MLAVRGCTAHAQDSPRLESGTVCEQALDLPLEVTGGLIDRLSRNVGGADWDLEGQLELATPPACEMPERMSGQALPGSP